MEKIAEGVWRVRIGKPESITPVSVRKTTIDTKGLDALPSVPLAPIRADVIASESAPRGLLVELPMAADEHIYGFGLQLKSHDQTGLKKHLRVNSDPVADTGDSHAPVPFYVSTRGYGVAVDTARYASFYCGTHRRVGAGKSAKSTSSIADSTEELYASRESGLRKMQVDIPVAQGVDIYIFAGPTIKLAVQRYNLFSGGGCLPAMWGLGNWYRGYGPFGAEDVLKLAESFRDSHMPCDVFGLEPGWQSQVYSCSYVWDSGRFPDPNATLRRFQDLGFSVNLWEHAFVHPTSPLYEKLKKLAGAHEVWDGLVPDFLVEEAVDIFGTYHREQFVERGVSGFKLDECDNSDFVRSPWSFPEHSRFPSGADGEQMHSLLGIHYQHTIDEAYRKTDKRTYSEVRSAHLLAAPYPFVLYSDLYAHEDFIRGVVNAGFSGLLWSPEVRQCASVEDLIRRLQSVVFSPQSLVNAWMIKHPPWKQVDREKNNNDEFMADSEKVEDACRELLQTRMRLVPYLYAAFAKYWKKGLPPFRALVMDYPDDPNVLPIDDAYMMGDELLVAPLTAGKTCRKIYLPEGDWYCFWTHQRFSGGMTYTVTPPLERIPVFVKKGALLPLAEPVEHITADTCFQLHMVAFGRESVTCTLFEDDGVSFGAEHDACNWLCLNWPENGAPQVQRSGCYGGRRYNVVRWHRVQ